MIDKMSSYVYDSPTRTDDRRTPMLRPVPNFRHKLASVGLGVDDVAQQASISRAAIFAWLNPGTQPCRKGIRLKNAWAVARVYAATAGIDKEAAFTSLFVDEPAEQALDQTGHLSGT